MTKGDEDRNGEAVLDYEGFDPWLEDRKLAMEQLRPVPVPVATTAAPIDYWDVPKGPHSPYSLSRVPLFAVKKLGTLACPLHRWRPSWWGTPLPPPSDSGPSSPERVCTTLPCANFQ